MLVQPYLKGKLNHFLYSLFILLVRTEDTSEIFYEDGISFIPLQNWSQGGKYKINTCFFQITRQCCLRRRTNTDPVT